MMLEITIGVSMLMQLTAGIISLRYSVMSKSRSFWLLLALSFLMFSMSSLTFFFESVQNSTIFATFRALLLGIASILFVICLIGFGRREAAAEPGESRHAVNELEIALKEKDILLKEVHHRVKNNLQVIASILDLSSLEISHKESCGLFEDAVAKISTMSIIHSQLYQSERFDRINMEEHLTEIIHYLKNFYENGNSHQYEISVDNGQYITLNQGVPVTLILTELISNTLKHAFLPDRRGTISIHFNIDSEKQASLRVRDNGRGIENSENNSGTDTMGLLLVRNLIQDQLKGRIEFVKDGGTEVIISFPFEDVYEYTKSNGC